MVTPDGTANGAATSSASTTVTLTTSKTNDDIIVAVASRRGSSFTTVSSVSDTAGLSWAKRSSVTLDNVGSNFHMDMEIWLANSPAALSNDVITVTLAAVPDTLQVIAFGLNGVPSSSPWDANGSLPVTNASAASSVPSISGISTTAA